jgi:hypothetical protein
MGNDCYVENRSELQDILAAFKRACEDIIHISTEKEGTAGIEYVFATKSYALKGINSNVTRDVASRIGNLPMNIHGDDWKDFLLSAPDLDSCDEETGFETDYGMYPLICMARKTKGRYVDYSDLHFYDANAIYERKRSVPTTIYGIDMDCKTIVNRIKAINCCLNKKSFQCIVLTDDMITIYGDNWYILYDSSYQIIESCALSIDPYAQNEMEDTKILIHEKRKELVKKKTRN